MSTQSLQRREGSIGEGGAARIFAAIALDDLGAERLLALEMIIEGTFGTPAAAVISWTPQPLKPFSIRILEPGVDDLLTNIGSCHGQII